MRTKMMTRVALQRFPTLMLAPAAALGLATVIYVGSGVGVCLAQDAAQPTAATTTEPTASPKPQGPYYARPLPPGASGMGMGGFPPMGFDPMTGTVAPNTGPDDAYAQAMNNRAGGGTGGNTGGDTQVDVQVRGHIGIGGRGKGQGGAHGLGNPGWGTYNGQGAPFRNGYGAPYGTPFNMGPTVPQYAPQALETESVETQAEEPTTTAASAALPQAAPAYPAVGPNYPQPFTWAPSGMPVPGLSTGPGAGAYVQPQGADPRANTAQPQQPDWVMERRAEAEKRRLEAEKRFTEMRNNNFYAGRGYGQGFGSGYGQPYGQGYGAPYGVPYGAPYGYAPQPQQQPQPQDTSKSEEKTN